MATCAEARRRPRAITNRGHAAEEGAFASYAELCKSEIPRERRRRPKCDIWKPGLFPIEIIDGVETVDYVRVHYIGWDSKYDETRRKTDIVKVACPIQPEMKNLKVQIKENLSPHGDSKITITQPMVEEDYECLKQIGTVYKVTKSKTVYKLSCRGRADQLLGCGWDFRVVNSNGDSFYIKTDTVRFYLKERTPLMDYIAFPDHVEENYLKRGKQLVFTFVKVPGNFQILKKLLNNNML